MSWSTCGDSCSARDGSGNQTRTRSPDTIVANGGADCTEEISEDQACTVECPVDCDWAAWGTWTNCTKIDSEDCAVQGGGNRERTRSQSIAEQNSGVDCEADSMDENWLCCADKDTDSNNCPNDECLEGTVNPNPECSCECGDVDVGDGSGDTVRTCNCVEPICQDCDACCQLCRTTELDPASADGQPSGGGVAVQSSDLVPLDNHYVCSALDPSFLPMTKECHPWG